MAEFKEFGTKAKNWTRAGLDKARERMTSAKLSLDNVSEEENKKKVLAEIGKRFVELHPDAPVGFEDLYRQLGEIEGKIEENRARMDGLGE